MKKYISSNNKTIANSGYQECLGNINAARDAVENFKHTEAFGEMVDHLVTAYNTGDDELKNTIIHSTEVFLWDVSNAVDNLKNSLGD